MNLFTTGNRRVVGVLAALLVCSGCDPGVAPLPERGADATASSSAASIKAGEPVTLTLTARTAPGDFVRFPEIAGEPLVRVLSRSQAEDHVAEDILRRTITLTLTSFRPGTHTMISGPVVLATADGREVDLRSVHETLVVEAVLSADDRSAPGPLKGPVRAPGDLARRLLVLLMVAVAAALAGVLTPRLVKNPRRDAAPPPDPADVVARRALAALRAKPWEPEPFFTELSLILRTYLDQRFALHAPERTTEELIRAFSADRRLLAQEQEMLRTFLTLADLVKFARADAEHTAMEDSIDLVETFVDQTASPEREAGSDPGEVSPAPSFALS